MYHKSLKGGRCCIGAGQTLYVHSPGGNTVPREKRHGRCLESVTSNRKSDVNRCLFIEVKNIAASFSV